MSIYDDLEAQANEFEQTLNRMRQTVRQGELHLQATRFAIAQGRARFASVEREKADMEIANHVFSRVHEGWRVLKTYGR